MSLAIEVLVFEKEVEGKEKGGREAPPYPDYLKKHLAIHKIYIIMCIIEFIVR